MKNKPLSKQPKNPVSGTPVVGVVHVNYTQINVPLHAVAQVAGELSQLILSDYYRRFLPENTSDSEG